MKETMTHRLLFLILALLFAAPVTAEQAAADAQDERANETAHLKGEAKLIADRIVSGQRAGWEDREFEPWAELWAKDAVRTWARSLEPGPYDQVFKAKDLLPAVRILVSGEDIGLTLKFTKISVQIDGDNAVMDWRFLITSDLSDRRELYSERFKLKRIDGVWKITSDRAWIVGVESEGKKTKLDADEWAKRDAAVERASDAGNLSDLRIALMDAYRMVEAYKVAVKMTEQDGAQAIDWSVRGMLAVFSSNHADAYPSFERAAEMDPDVWLPYFAKPRDKKD